MKLIIDALSARVAALEQKAFGHPRQRWGKSQLAKHEGCSTREIDRRRGRGVYAEPEVENGRLYWWSDSYRRVPSTSTADTPELRAARNPQRHKPAQPNP